MLLRRSSATSPDKLPSCTRPSILSFFPILIPVVGFQRPPQSMRLPLRFHTKTLRGPARVPPGTQRSSGFKPFLAPRGLIFMLSSIAPFSTELSVPLHPGSTYTAPRTQTSPGSCLRSRLDLAYRAPPALSPCRIGPPRSPHSPTSAGTQTPGGNHDLRPARCRSARPSTNAPSPPRA